MTHPTVAPAALPPRSVPAAARPRPALDTPLARRVLGEALLLGITADALLRDSITGLAFPAFVAIAALALVALTWRAGRQVPRETAAWLATAVAFAATVAWRDDPLLQAAGVLTTGGALLMAAIAAYRPEAALLAPRLRDLADAALSRVATGIPGFAPLVLREAVEPGDTTRTARRLGPALRAIALALVLVLVFGALLRGADPIFASLVALPDIDVGELVSHLVVVGVFAWLAAGWARAALDQRTPSPSDLTPPFRLGTLEVTVALGALDALFTLYVLAQLGWFFGGERFLQERTGLTAAEYARQGFFQVVLVALLVIPVLLATRAMLAPERGLARRHTLLSLPLVGLVLAIIVSAATRLQLYVQYFGLTIDRLFPMAFMGWLALVLAWLAVTVLRDRGERFVAGALGSGLVALMLLNLASPDAIVARVNVARAQATDSARMLDLVHLASLSGEAAPIAVAAVTGSVGRSAPADQRCDAARLLQARWGTTSRRAQRHRADGAWRAWNAGDATALRAVEASTRALRAVQHEACAARLATSRTATRGIP